MADPITRLAKLRIIKASADLDVEISSIAGNSWLKEIYQRFLDKAAESLSALAFVDAEDPKAIRILQNEVKKYDEFVDELRAILHEGIAEDSQMRQDERDEMFDILSQTPEGQNEAIELGLVDDGSRDDH